MNSQKVKKKMKKESFDVEPHTTDEMTSISANPHHRKNFKSGDRLHGTESQRHKHQPSSPMPQQKQDVNLFPEIDSRGDKRHCQNAQIRGAANSSNCQVKKNQEREPNLASSENVGVNR